MRDGATLDGEIVLTVKDGQLVDVRLPVAKTITLTHTPELADEFERVYPTGKQKKPKA